MKVSDFTYLLQHPDKVVDPVQTKHLEDVLEEYPYFQAARALHLKGLKNLNSFKYNNALKVTAAYTADRDILFDFITSKEFLQNSIADTISGKTPPLGEKEIISEEIIPDPETEPSLIEESEDLPLPRSAKDADTILDPSLFKSKDPAVDKAIEADRKRAAEELELGKPIAFSKKEKYSFGEWLQLTNLKSVKRKPKEVDNSKAKDLKEIHFPLDEDLAKKKKFDLIDKFIAHNPKIVPKEHVDIEIDIKESTKMDKEELMTETLAKVYLEQKKYKKAIQAYKILSLKYPEKSGFFADRIKAVEKIQQEKSD
ncbi:hypothetical protein [Poritiphilus flavus]|uniref:Tetratricopeptide repeat-containing protein n=1 Tax=Poritiphilus flavus TaxID=2697053 RepID=A0A6L9EDX1_9FLAO|nr:hypothetical protein [Poritiphilus flavus]NAS12841.1 hypothetical protein [Poritiphilus flavus]